MKSPLSPSDIEVLLHCHTCPEPHPRLKAVAVEEALAMFEDCDMISKVGRADIYTTTAKGKMFIRMLCETPAPIEIWIDPRKNI